MSAFDALHEIRPVSKHPIIASLHKPLPAFGWAPFTHPHIEVRQSIAQLDPETRMVTFEDGSTVSNVDIIFFATGYDFSFPFLPSVEIRNRRIQGLYQHVFKIDDPSLGFVGMVSLYQSPMEHWELTLWKGLWGSHVPSLRMASRYSSSLLRWARNASSRKGYARVGTGKSLEFRKRVKLFQHSFRL